MANLLEYDRLIEDTVRAYEALRADPAAWQAELAERALWDTTLSDGLDPNENWSVEGVPREAPDPESSSHDPKRERVGKQGSQ